MGDMGDHFNDVRQHVKEQRCQRLARFLDSDLFKTGRFTAHTGHHFSTTVPGKDAPERVDYWPSTGKWQFRKKIIRGSLGDFTKVLAFKDAQPA